MTGLNCEGCKEHYPYAEANQPNGKLVCYGCKANGFVYNAPKNNWLHYSDVSINPNIQKYITADTSYVQTSPMAWEQTIKALEDEEEKLLNLYQDRYINKTQATINSCKKNGIKFVDLLMSKQATEYWYIGFPSLKEENK